MTFIRPFFLLFILSFVFTPTHAATFTELGPVIGNLGDIHKTRLANNGKAAAWNSDKHHPYRWTLQHGVQPLHNPDDPNSASKHFTVWGIDNSGEIIVGNTGDKKYNFAAALWTDKTGETKLQKPPTIIRYSARNISSNGKSIILDKTVPQKNERAFRWSKNYRFKPIGGRLKNYKIIMKVRGISDDSSTIVGWIADQYHKNITAFASINDKLHYLPQNSSKQSLAKGVSGNGLFVVGSFANTGKEINSAFVWPIDGPLYIIDPLPNTTGITANDITNDGSIAVGFTYKPNRGVFWTQTDGTQPIENLLTEWGLDEYIKDLTFKSVQGISNDGNTILGIATRPDDTSFLWLAQKQMPPPTPSITK
ncbi:hypothetical protein JD969_08725 [Planctomycetota bacterium]|nr:hypothetical protein JD969_08725 [Planctomycetota bacterium]